MKAKNSGKYKIASRTEIHRLETKTKKNAKKKRKEILCIQRFLRIEQLKKSKINVIIIILLFIIPFVKQNCFSSKNRGEIGNHVALDTTKSFHTHTISIIFVFFFNSISPVGILVNIFFIQIEKTFFFFNGYI